VENVFEVGVGWSGDDVTTGHLRCLVAPSIDFFSEGGDRSFPVNDITSVGSFSSNHDGLFKVLAALDVFTQGGFNDRIFCVLGIEVDRGLQEFLINGEIS
jgi:hypothetical protein